MSEATKRRGFVRSVLWILLSCLPGASSEATVEASFTFSPSSPVAGEEVQFTDTSTGNPTNWLWSFGDGTESTLQNPTVTFASAGTYTIQLIASVPPFDISQVFVSITVTAPGVLSFAASSSQASESVGVAVIAVRRAGGPDGVVSVRCSTIDGSATAGNDYTATKDILTWADDDTATKNCTIPVIDDTLSESDETIHLTLSNVTGGATLGSPSTAVLTLVDDDATGSGELSFTASIYEVAEDGGSAAVTVQRTGGFDGAVSARCSTSNGTATAGVDYIATTQTLSWADGNSSAKTCEVTVVDDAEEEADETIFLSLSNFTGGATQGSATSATLTVLANDFPPCVADAQTLCLNGGRFKIQSRWRDPQNQTGDGQAVEGSDDSGLFWFFSANNWEILVKVLDGCAVNGHAWVLAAATTNVEYILVVTDTVTGETSQYQNPLGTQADAIIDTKAFSSCF